jgi:riboflavin biosynthesis pyrimidine reductase
MGTSVPYRLLLLPRSPVMRRLHPNPHESVSVVEAYAEATRQRSDGRPWVLMCMIASADGATAGDGRSGPLGGAGDRAVFGALRELTDIVLVGAGTARDESYGPPRRESLRIAIVTKSLRLDWNSELLQSGRAIVVTSETAGVVPDGIPAVRAGHDDVDLALALQHLGALGVGIVMAEGGPSLNGTLVAAGLVDELCLTVSPHLVGGSSSRVAHGSVAALTHLSLAHVLEEDGWLFLRYVADASGSR